MKGIKAYFGIYIRGILMGAADVIPGVSGGTIAFITGIYETLIQSLNEVDLKAFKLLFTFRWKALIHKINGFFLLAMSAGILSAVLSLARLLKYLLEEYPEAVWAFFFGLIVASVLVIAKHIKHWQWPYYISLAVGGVIAWYLTESNVIDTPDTYPYIFFSGVIAIVAMILPGISGSFILVILNKYEYIIDLVSGISLGIKEMVSGAVSGDWQAVSTAWGNTTILPLVIFELGTISGIIGFSKVLNWLFKKYHDLTIALLTGFLVGSLNKVWPWKEVLETKEVRGKIKVIKEQNIFPDQLDSYFAVAVGLAILGFVLVYGMEKYSENKKART